MADNFIYAGNTLQPYPKEILLQIFMDALAAEAGHIKETKADWKGEPLFSGGSHHLLPKEQG